MPTVSVVEIDDSGNEIEGSEKNFQVDTGDVIFDALDNKGCKLPHGCLSGSCGSCRIMVIDGENNLANMSVIESNTVNSIVEDYKSSNIEYVKGKPVRLSCRARVNGDIKITALKE